MFSLSCEAPPSFYLTAEGRKHGGDDAGRVRIRGERAVHPLHVKCAPQSGRASRQSAS
jgi:hypothetical protein